MTLSNIQSLKENLTLVKYTSNNDFYEKILLRFTNSMEIKLKISENAKNQIQDFRVSDLTTQPVLEPYISSYDTMLCESIHHFDTFIMQSKSALDILSKIINLIHYDTYNTPSECFNAKIYLRPFFQTDNRTSILFKMNNTGKLNSIYTYLNNKTQQSWFQKYLALRNKITHVTIFESISSNNRRGTITFKEATLPIDPDTFPYKYGSKLPREYCLDNYLRIEETINNTLNKIIIELIRNNHNHPL